jgi:hypothetical protein
MDALVAAGVTTGSRVLRGLVAASVLLSGVIHLELWADGMSVVAVIGPAFLVNAVAGLVLGVWVLLDARPWSLLLSAGFGAATLAAFVVSTLPSGLFGVHETWVGAAQVLCAVAEALAVVLALAALAIERRAATARPSAAGTASQPSRSGSAART